MSKKSTRSTFTNHLPPLNGIPKEQATTDMLQDLLSVGKIHVNYTKLEEYRPSNKEFATSRKKSHKSLGTNLEEMSQRAAFRVKATKKNTMTEAVRKDTERTEKQQVENQSAAQSKEEEYIQQKFQVPVKEVQKEQKFHFKEKKMKIGKKAKTDLMKQFILETLAKGRAEATSLTINKGTAQCNFSPPKKELQQSHPKREYPTVLAQQQRKRLPLNRRPPQSSLNINQRSSVLHRNQNHKTSVRLPSLSQNNKWVAMARNMETKHKQKEPEVIPQMIVAEEETSQHQIIQEALN